MEEKEDNTNSSIKNINIQSLDILNKENNINEIPKEKDEKEKGEAEQNLMFGVKKLSPFKLYYNISGKFEIFLMIMGAVFTIGAGCSNALISLLLGDTINDFTDTNEIDNLSDDE